MSFETELVALLRTKCPQVYADVAPLGALKPYVTWQGLGGESLDFLDNTAADKRNTLMQISCWSNSRLVTLILMREIETALRGASFIASPVGEPASFYEDDGPLYGSIQRFSIYSIR